MDVAIVSDIHSNLVALEAVLHHLGRLPGRDREWTERAAPACSCGEAHVETDALWCLGDTVGYNADPRACLHLMRRHADVLLLGNHDWAAITGDYHTFNKQAAAGIEHTLASLDPNDRTFLESCAADEHVKVTCGSGHTHEALLCHASPDDPLWEYLDEASAARFLDRKDMPPLVAFGHTHVPFALRGADGRLVMNVGSVGQPRDGDPRACFVTLNLDDGEPTFHRVTYDTEAAAHANAKAGLPSGLGERLMIGR